MMAAEVMPATLRAEFVDCMVHVMGTAEVYRLHLGGVVRFDGRLDEARLACTMRLLLDAEPVLGCRFDADAMPPRWRRIDGLDQAHLLDVTESDDPATAAAEFIALPFESDTVPRVAAVLVHAPAGDTLSVRIGHVAADGGALKETLYLIGQIYRELGERPAWTPVPNVDGTREPVVEAGFFERMRLIAKSGQLEFAPPSDWGTVPGLGERGPVSYVSTWVEPDTFCPARALGKPLGATVNDIIVTALYRTFFRLVGAAPGGKTPVLMTVDLRQHLPEGTKTALANISSAWTIHLTAVEGEQFEETLARVVEVTREWKLAGGGRAAAAGIPAARKMIGGNAVRLFRKQVEKMMEGADDNPGGPVPLLTNIGVIDETRLDFGPDGRVIDAYLFAPASHQGLALAASTYRDRLHLSCGTEFASMDERLATDLVVGTAREIGAWVDGGSDRGRV